MERLFTYRPLLVALALTAGSALALACKSDGDDGMGPDGDPAIGLTINPASATVEQGGTADVTGTITRSGGFTGTVTVTVQGAPVGVTATVGDVQTSGTTTTATITIEVGLGAEPGVYALTVRGAGTGVSDATATFELTVTEAPPSYTMTLAPDALAIPQGEDGAVEIVLERINFTGDVTLSLEGAPDGVTATFDPGTVDGDGAVLGILVGGGVATGEYALTVRGVAMGLEDRTAPLTLTVVEPPSYSLSVDPSALSVEQGTAGETTVSIARTNFAGAVTLSLGNAPEGVTGAFDPAAPEGDASTLTVTVGGMVEPGDYELTVNGTSSLDLRGAVVGGAGVTGAFVFVETATLALTVTEAPASYTLSVTPDGLAIEQGGDGSVEVAVERVNFAGDVELTLEGAPDGVTGAFDPNPASGDASLLAITVDGAVAAGEYEVTVRGVATGLDDRTAVLVLTVVEPASYTLSVEPAALSIEQGKSGGATVAIARTNFEGAVTLALDGAPAGVTGEFDPAAPTGDASALTVTVGGDVAPGVYAMAVVGTSSLDVQGAAAASALVETAALTLTVTEAAGFALGMDPSSVSVVQGGSTSSTIVIERSGGFDGTVDLTVSGAPAGLTATPNPGSTGENAATLEITAASDLAPGEYTLTVAGNATGFDERTTTLGVTVTEAGGSSIVLDFSQCALGQRPIWLAFQSGTGPWTQVVGAGDRYEFTVSADRVGVAYVTGDTDASAVVVQYLTDAEATEGLVEFCSPEQTKAVTGTVAGLGIGETAILSLGGGVANAFTNGGFEITGVAEGTHDLVAYKRSAVDPGAGDRMFFMRDQNVADGESVGTVDFAGAEAFDAASATMTVSGAEESETVVHQMNYYTATGSFSCTPSSLYVDFLPSGTAFSAWGAPEAEQRTGDLHAITVSGAVSDAFRSTTESFKVLADRTVALGTALPAPTVTPLTGNYKRLAASLTLPSEYTDWATFSYFDTALGTRSVSLFATIAWLGGAEVELVVPDFSAVSGWDDAWAPAPADEVSWAVSGTGSAGVCTEGGRSVTAIRSGTAP